MLLYSSLKNIKRFTKHSEILYDYSAEAKKISKIQRKKNV